MSPTLQAAVEIVLDDRFRAPGCAKIVMVDGREYHVLNGPGRGSVERYSPDGTLIERVDAQNVGGLVNFIQWSRDELGGIYIR
jgi:hypothetical protein